MDGKFGEESIRIADLGRLHVKYPFIAMMPQWDFLNFLRESGKQFACLNVMMNANATDLIRSGDAVVGIQADTP
jgi:2-polyprenyl-6-methoxyphenol hydroxylase-like FAD-dependent oxidoreductase